MSAAQPSLLRIGPFSRLARVTIKTLRFYDAAQVFQPAWTDPRSGYRFYSTAQLPLLRRIRLLRELGCSLVEIQQLVTSHPDGQLSYAQVGALRRRLLVGVALAERRLRQLDELLTANQRGPLPIRVRRIAATPAFTIRDSVRAGGTDIHRMFESAERQVARFGSRSHQSPFMLLHDMDYHRTHIDVEVCIPTHKRAPGEAGVRLIEPVARAACVQFSGDYAQASALFDATLDSMHGSRARVAGPVREVYLRFGADQRGYKLDPRFLTNDVRQYRTELQIPLARG